MKPSLGPNGNGRRGSSLGNDRRLSMYNKGGMVDPRPIKDKTYIRKCTERVREYLMKKGCETLPGQLGEPPSSKTFRSMVEFLFRQIDPSIQINKIEEDIPFYFSKFKYPFRITKAALQSPSSPLTWPSLLAALHWLVELLIMYELVVNEQDGNEMTDNNKDDLKLSIEINMQNDKEKEKRLESDKYSAPSSFDNEHAILVWFSHLYHKWLSGEDDMEGIHRTVRAAFQKQEEDLKLKTQMYEKANDQLKAELQKINNIPTVQDLRQKKQELIEDLGKHKDYVEALKEHKKKLEDKRDQTKHRLGELNGKLESDRARLESLKVTLSQQAISPSDVERMRHTEEQLDIAINEMVLKLDRQKKEIYQKSHTLKDVYGKLGSKVAEYNDLAPKLQPYFKNHNMKIELNFDPDVKEEILKNPKNTLISRDLKTIRTWIEQSREVLEEKIFQAKRRISELKNNLEGCNQKIENYKIEQIRLKERTEADKKEIERLNQEWKEIEDKFWKEVQQIELETQPNVDRALEIQKLKTQLDECQKAYDQSRIQCQLALQDAAAFIKAIMNDIVNDRKNKRAQLLEMKLFLSKCRDETHSYHVKDTN